MKDSKYFLFIGIIYCLIYKYKDLFFLIIYGLSMIEMTYITAKNITTNKIKIICLLLCSLMFTYIFIKDWNPFYHALFFYLPFQNYFKGLMILTFNSFMLYKLFKLESYLFKSIIENVFSSFKKCIFIFLFFAMVHFLIYLYQSKYYIYFTTPQYIQENKNQKYYICANLFNNEDILEDWLIQMKLLISYLGTSNVYVSIFENGDSKDLTGEYLEDFREYLNELSIPNKIITTKQLEKGNKDRIVFMAMLRNKALEFLYEISPLDWNSTTILFFNDIIYNYQDIINLISTNNGDYDAVCGMDYYECFYDAWVSIGLDGQRFRDNYPYFINKVAQDAFIEGETIRTFSCWNGVIAIKAKPFENKTVEFRHGIKRNESECTLMNADLYSNGYGKVLLNPNLIFTYEYFYYYKTKYVNPWAKNIFTYFYYYFVYGFRQRNWNMIDVTSRMANFTQYLQNVFDKFYVK